MRSYKNKKVKEKFVDLYGEENIHISNPTHTLTAEDDDAAILLDENCEVHELLEGQKTVVIEDLNLD